MQLADWLRRIEGLHPRSWDLGLDRVGEVADRLGVRSPAPRIFLVAGTNGKGSVCTLIANLCRSMGLTAGLTTSPHLLRFNERIVVNGREATDAEICEAFATIDEARGEISLTYFEFAALAAFLIFRRHAVDVAVLEVGLGGRLDAMNIVEPDVSVITRIALDHQNWLGDTREQIAIEKAGIMRSARPCILGDPDMPGSLMEQADRVGCRLHRIDEDFVLDGRGSFRRIREPAVTVSGLPEPILA
ncbi:MAG: bifunctional tetrahydrofolate synthase/dihydrofolate synthase, partial [Pseudomonadales bacterium]|nr:bifunctional tetrahydrofolate synthase/dihydrofolate synthase [Pseudomonadales bacterium]